MDKTLLQTFSDRAAQKRKDRTTAKEFDFPGIGKLPFLQLKQRDQLELIGRATENQNDFRELMGLNVEMIYDCCPALQDAELQKELNVVDPYDTVRILLDITEIQKLSTQLSEWMGLSGAKEEETPVKNS